NTSLQPDNEELSKNTICQYDSVAKINSINKTFLISSIISKKQIVTEQTKRLEKLKHYAKAQ
ncbi:16882_t:CDS:2, partial [Gigaspora margarita]